MKVFLLLLINLGFHSDISGEENPRDGPGTEAKERTTAVNKFSLNYNIPHDFLQFVITCVYI